MYKYQFYGNVHGAYCESMGQLNYRYSGFHANYTPKCEPIHSIPIGPIRQTSNTTNCGKQCYTQQNVMRYQSNCSLLNLPSSRDIEHDLCALELLELHWRILACFKCVPHSSFVRQRRAMWRSFWLVLAIVCNFTTLSFDFQLTEFVATARTAHRERPNDFRIRVRMKLGTTAVRRSRRRIIANFLSKSHIAI